MAGHKTQLLGISIWILAESGVLLWKWITPQILKMSSVIPDSFKIYPSDLSASSTFSTAITSQTLVKGSRLIVKLFKPPTFLSYSQNKLLNICLKDLYKPLDKADKSCKTKYL